jgi:DNA phosphorothioation-associated putative methyltransferase
MPQDAIQQGPLGKRVGLNTYHHVENLQLLERFEIDQINKAITITGILPGERFNVIKLAHVGESVTLLNYPAFFDEAFPVLANHWTVDLVNQTYRYRTYADSLNPPILHRKELLLPKGHPQNELFQTLTKAAEQIGLFDDPNRIGFKRAWDTLLAQRGYKVVGHDLVPIGNDETGRTEADPTSFEGIARHLTALTRYGFSAPMQALARFGFLDGSKSVFDYGCGRGDDLRGLRENNITAGGWDPHFAPDDAKQQAQLVNLGFVINVIESIDERIDAIRGAYALANELLVISAMLANQEAVTGTPYGDGVLTSRNTFQKYYTQGELRHFIGEVLGEEPIPVGPGIFFVFKDKDAEQRFMYGRLENRRNILRLSQLSRPERPIHVSRAEVKYEEHRQLLEALWETCLTLGRDPDRSEIPNHAEVTTAIGSLPVALRFIKSRKERADEILSESRQSRINDLRVYFAQLQFEKRKPYRHLEERLQKDIRVFFGDYRAASDAGRELLFTVADIEAIGNACHQAAERGIGWLEDSESLQLHTSLVEQLPPILRTYVHCGTLLYGDVSSADLIKIHIRSAKLTLMKFDDFAGKPLPRMIQRVKLNLRKQDLAIFDYEGIYEPPYLYRKSRLINEEFQNFAEQGAFEEALDEAGLMQFTGYGPSPSEFDRSLEERRYAIEGFELVRSKNIPDLDTPCGRYLTYRQLIECGETQARTGLPNLPKEADSYTALLELARNVLDPVIEYFGMIRLTYGFCSPELAKQIPGRIAPELDQHAAHEKKRNGKYVCERLGAACDFIVEDEDMEAVVQWICEKLEFDRIYIADRDRPIHISWSSRPIKQVVELITSPTGRLVPRIRRSDHADAQKDSASNN